MKFSELFKIEERSVFNLPLLTVEDVVENKTNLNLETIKEMPRDFYFSNKVIVGYRYHKPISKFISQHE